MAMGNISGSGPGSVRLGSPTAGSFRGSTTIRAVVNVFQQYAEPDYPPVALNAYILNMQTNKIVDGSPGTWEVTIKGDRMVPGTVQSGSWDGIFTKDDWVIIAITDAAQDGRVWPLMIGLIDNVRPGFSTNDGARVRTWTIGGRDLTKCLTDTQITSAVYTAFDPVLSGGASYRLVDALDRANNSINKGPSSVLPQILSFLMGADVRPEGVSFWRVPRNLNALFTGGAAPSVNQRQFTDVLDVSAYVTPNLPGQIAVNGNFGAENGVGNQVWDTLKSYSNGPLNEMWVDFLPNVGNAATSPLSYVSETGNLDDFIPALVLRERPFPSLPGSVPHRGANVDPWTKLPTTVVLTRDLESVDLTQGAENYNFFLMQSGNIQLPKNLFLEQSENPEDQLFAGVPAINRDSIQIHGLQRLELSTNYVGTGGDKDLNTFFGWTRLLRDWYGPCLDFYSGTVTTITILPGVRVGERFIISDLLGASGGDVEFYVEGVAHSLVMVNGAAQHRTTLTLTRGHQNPVAAVAEYAAKFQKQGRSAIAQQSPAPQPPRSALDDELFSAIDDLPTPLTGGPQDVVGTSPTGDIFDVPSATE